MLELKRGGAARCGSGSPRARTARLLHELVRRRLLQPMDVMFDTERFITAIRKHDCLWNPNASTYYNRDMKWDAWVEVYRVVLEEEDEYFEELSSLDQKRKIEDLQKRWKNVRDQFKKFQNKIQLLDAEAIAKLAKPYIYAESLDFLIPVLETKTIKRPRTSNSRSVRKRRQTIDQQTLAAAAGSGTATYGLRKKIVKTENDVNKTEPKENNHDKTMLGETDSPIPSKLEEEGPEKLFLLSLLPQIKELNSDQKNYLYIEFLQAIQKAKHFISPRYNFNYVMNQYNQQVQAAQAQAASQQDLVKSERISSSSSSTSSSSDDDADDTPVESATQQQPAIL